MVLVQATSVVLISNAGTDKYCCSSLQGCHVQLESREGDDHFAKLNVRWDVYVEFNVMAHHVFFRFHIKERGTAEQREESNRKYGWLVWELAGKRSAPGRYRDPMTLRHKRRPVCCAT